MTELSASARGKTNIKVNRYNTRAGSYSAMPPGRTSAGARRHVAEAIEGTEGHEHLSYNGSVKATRAELGRRTHSALTDLEYHARIGVGHAMKAATPELTSEEEPGSDSTRVERDSVDIERRGGEEDAD